jgi:hypothetical protein
MDVVVPVLMGEDGEEIVVGVAAEDADAPKAVGVDPTRIMSLLTSTHVCPLKNAVSFTTAVLPATLALLRIAKRIRAATLDKRIRDPPILSRLTTLLVLPPIKLVTIFATCWRMRPLAWPLHAPMATISSMEGRVL